MSLLDKIFGTHSEREIKLVEKTVDEIEALRSEMMSLSDEAFCLMSLTIYITSPMNGMIMTDIIKYQIYACAIWLTASGLFAAVNKYVLIIS